MVLARIENALLYHSPEAVEQRRLEAEQAALEAQRLAEQQAKEAQESDRISEAIRQQLDNALRVAKTEFVQRSNWVARNFLQETNPRSQRVLTEQIPSKAGPVGVEVRGIYPEGIRPTEKTPFDAIVVIFPRVSEEAYVLSEGNYRTGKLRDSSLFPNTSDLPRLYRGNIPEGPVEPIPLADAIALRDTVVSPLLASLSARAEAISSFTPNPSLTPEGV